MSITGLLGRMLGLGETQAIERVAPSLAAPWAHDAPAWLLFGCLALFALVAAFYAKYQAQRRIRPRIMLTIARGLLLSLLLLILAEPILTVTITSRLRPALWVLFDGTDSMAVADELPESQQPLLAKKLRMPEPESSAGPTGRFSRVDYVKALVNRSDDNLLAKLSEKFRLRAFIFDRPDGVRSLELDQTAGGGPDRKHLAEQLTTDGQVTALGAALDDLGRRHAAGNLTGLVIVSDFNQNTGPPALDAARRLGVNVYTIGVGPVAAADVAVDLQTPLVMKKDERSTLVATLRQKGLIGKTVAVKFSFRPLGGSTDPAQFVAIGQRTVNLRTATQAVELPYTPKETGRFLFACEAEPLEDEVVEENNRARREATVRDDFLRLLFVEYEPTWEWRFIKEVFHRDELVGRRGFRTFLRSADPRVRQNNELFLTTLSPERSEFFAHDVIFLGDVPATALSPRFCRMAKEFVQSFGGGLVVLAGPRFGPGQLADSPLADLLPVKVNPNARIRDNRPFPPRLTAEAYQFDFMRLGSTDRETDKAWANVGSLSWYWPVERLAPLATALAVHPRDTCVDGKMPQPLIAVHQYGRGEVIYVGFNETWRLRRKYGERYYRQFWGQMIHRLALRHALGAQKRFVVRTDRRRYQPDEQAVLTVEAYDADFKPLADEKIPGRRLSAELILPRPDSSGQSKVEPLGISQLRRGVFEARIPVFVGGEHRVRVKDPITDDYAEVTFQVASLSAERQSAIRNTTLEQAIADVTGGKSYDLATADRLPDEIKLVAKTETAVEIVPLWNTWLCFVCVIALMLGEWLGRKWVNLP